MMQANEFLWSDYGFYLKFLKPLLPLQGFAKFLQNHTFTHAHTIPFKFQGTKVRLDKLLCHNIFSTFVVMRINLKKNVETVTRMCHNIITVLQELLYPVTVF